MPDRLVPMWPTEIDGEGGSYRWQYLGQVKEEPGEASRDQTND